MYTTDYILTVIPINFLVYKNGEPTTPHKLASGTKPSSSSSYYQSVSVSQWRAHSRAVVFHTLHRGQIDTRLCPYLV